MKKILKRLRYFKISDIIAPFIFLIIFIPSLIFKLNNKIKKRNLWLICEDGQTARDNGYHFFKYVRTQHNKDNCYYVIDKKQPDYNKVKEYRNIIQYKSLKHWLYYLAADYNISNHKHGNPCQSFFGVIHVIFGLYKNRVFLQHGITINDSPWIYYKNTKFKYFVCAAKKEYEFIKEKFGYPEQNIIYTGFPRFDNLYNNKINKKQILIMPTWRNWLGGNYLTDDHFKKTEYFQKWNGLLNNKEMIDYIEKNDYIIYFYPHQHSHKFLHLFTTKSKNIKIIDNSVKDIQDLLKESYILITDYSSVLMDFSYMGKSSLYYLFDIEKFRSNHLKEGYFNYEKGGFGPTAKTEEDLVSKLIKIIETKQDVKYKKRIDNFFVLRDQNNSKRIYNILKNEQG